MIAKALKRGTRTLSLLHYLYGPGRANEHADPHMVAAWRDFVADPARDSSASLEMLAMQLDMPVHALEARNPGRHVWHGTVALSERDRVLTDAEWSEIAREMVAAAGLAPDGDDLGCRWVAVRHDERHIHIVATMARQDGTRPDSRGFMDNNYRRMRERVNQLEERYGLERTAPIDRTAERRPTRAESEKAARNSRSETPRETLKERVRVAAASSTSDAEFFAAVEASGIRLKRRVAPDGKVTGYAVALPTDRTAEGRAIWFSGSSLAPDLSLPRVRERWNGAGPRAVSADALPTVASRAEAWQRAAEHVHQAAAVLGGSGQDAAAAEVSALGDFVAAAAVHGPAYVRDELRQAAKAYERAGRAPTSRRARSAAGQHLQSATRFLLVGTAAGSGGGEGAAAVALLAALALAVIAARRWHQAHQFAQQERAAAAAGAHLRTATQIVYGATSGRNGRAGAWFARPTGAESEELTRAYAGVLGDAVPQLAERIAGEDAWPALAATLKAAESAGYDARTVLAEAAAERGFGDADSAAEVLVWRLQRRLTNDAEGPREAAVPSRREPRTPIDADRYAAMLGAISETFRESGTASRVWPRITARLERIDAGGGDVEAVVRAAAEEFANRSPRQNVTSAAAAALLGATQRTEVGSRPATATGRAGPSSVRVGSGDDTVTLGEAVHSAVPSRASEVLGDPAAEALAKALREAADAGHDPTVLLGEVAVSRELDTAENTAQVLTWRVQGRLRNSGAPQAMRVQGSGPEASEEDAARVAAARRRTEAERAAREARERNGRGPRR